MERKWEKGGRDIVKGEKEGGIEDERQREKRWRDSESRERSRRREGETRERVGEDRE